MEDDLHKEFDIIIKMIIVGESNVGKTSLLNRFVNGSYAETQKPTVGVDLQNKILHKQNKNFRLQIFDTAGQERFHSIVSTNFAGSHCAAVVFEVNKRKSFDKLSYWFEKINNNCPFNVKMVLIGNKTDLISEREVSYDEAKQYAESIGVPYMETSAKNDDDNCVEKAFDKLIDLALPGLIQEEEKMDELTFREVGRKTLVLRSDKNVSSKTADR